MARLIALFAIIIMLGGASAERQSIFKDMSDNMTHMTPDEALESISSGIPINGKFINGSLDLYNLGSKSLDGVVIQNCRIDGNFNMSGLYLKTKADLSNTVVNGSVKFNGGRFEGEVILNDAGFFSDVSFNHSTFARGIQCRNTFFNGSTDFSYSSFSGHVDFTHVKFIGDANFMDTKFLGKTTLFEYAYFGRSSEFPNLHADGNMYFSNANFSGSMLFLNWTIDGLADFESARFGSTANFAKNTFNGVSFRNCTFENNTVFKTMTFNKDNDPALLGADFSLAEFKGDVSFPSAKFNGDTSFREAHFWGRSSFNSAEFNGDKLDLTGVHFADDTTFDSAEFNGDAIFKRVQFEGNSSFYSATIKGDTSFIDTRFGNNRSTIANFTLTEFEGDTVMTDISFNNPKSFISFNDSKIYRLDIEWDQIKDNLKYDGSTYLALIKNFRELERFEDADNCYYTYRSKKQNDPGRRPDLKILDFISLLSCGYGVSLTHTFGLSIMMMLLFAGWFWLFGRNLENAILFSVIIFLQAPRSERYSSMTNRHKYAVIFEQMLGWCLMAVFIVVLTRKLILS